MSRHFLHVLESCAPGGMETTFLNVLREFRAADPWAEHHVLTFAGGGLEPAFRATATRLTVDPHDRAIDECLALRPDLVHLLFERCAYRLMPRLVARSAAPVVYGKGYDLGGMYRLNDGFDWSADEAMCAAADRVTFTTPALARGYRLPPGRRTVLRKAAATRVFAGIPEVGPHTPARILCVANLHPRKRLGDLILALREVRLVVPQAELRFVGGGNDDERARLVRVALECGVADHVSFAGIVTDVAPEIAQARVVALPSAREGVSTALLEAMAAGRPVVSTRAGHVDSIIDDGVEGFLIDVGDVTALASRLRMLLSDPARCQRMGATARARAAGHDVALVARHLLSALHTAADQSHPTPRLLH